MVATRSSGVAEIAGVSPSRLRYAQSVSEYPRSRHVERESYTRALLRRLGNILKVYECSRGKSCNDLLMGWVETMSEANL